MHIDETIKISTNDETNEFTSFKAAQAWLDEKKFDLKGDFDIIIYRYVPWRNEDGRVVLSEW